MVLNNPLLFIAIVIVFLTSCGDGVEYSKGWEKGVTTEKDFLELFAEDSIKSQVLINDSSQLLKPYKLNRIGDYLFISEGADVKYLYTVYNLKDQKFVGHFLNPGKGPIEYFRTAVSQYGKDSLLVLDMFKQQLHIYPLNDSLSLKSVPDRIVRLTHAKKGDYAVWFSALGETFLTSGLFQEGRYHTFDAQGNFLHSFGTYPAIDCHSKYDNQHLGGLFGYEPTAIDNDQKRIVCINRHALMISEKTEGGQYSNTFDLQWESEILISPFYDHGIAIAPGDSKQGIGAGTTCYNNRYLFCPYTELSFDEAANFDPTFYGSILVFDWNGKPVRKLKLDRRIIYSLTIDNSGDKLLALTINRETGLTEIVTFDISFLNKQL